MERIDAVVKYIERRGGLDRLECGERFLLFEAFTSPYDWWISGKDADGVNAEFATGDGRNIEVLASKYTGNDSVAELEFSDAEQYGVTGQGDAFRIFSTIVSIAKAMLANKRYGIKVLTFSASEPSRRKLYARMLKRLAKPYSVARIDGVDKKKQERFAVAKAKDLPNVETALLGSDLGGWKLSKRSV